MTSLSTKNAKQEKYGVTWQLDGEIFECNECRKPFNAFRRRHHCRNCGMIFCNDCSKNKMSVRGSANPKRVCDPCKLILVPLTQSSSTETTPGSTGASAGAGAGANTSANTGNTGRGSSVKSINSNANRDSSSVTTAPKQECLEEIVLRWADALMDGASVTCHFQGMIVLDGTACWYRHSLPECPASLSSRVEIERQRLTSSRDCLYMVKKSDVGYYLTCEIETNKQQIQTTSEIQVTQALPGLQSVNIGLRLHQHTLRCDRSERVCDAVGKFREGETLFMSMITRGMDNLDPSQVKCSYRWLQSATKLAPATPKSPQLKKKTSSSAPSSMKTLSPKSPKKSLLTKASFRTRTGTKTYTQAIVIFDFAAIEANEMSVQMGSMLTDVEVVDSDWARGSCNGMRGAVPTTYIQLDAKHRINETAAVNTAAVNAEEEGKKSTDVVVDEIDSSDDEQDEASSIAKKWRGSIYKMCEWNEIASGTTTCDQTCELKIGLNHVGYMIALDVTLEDLPKDALIEQIHKKSLPVGPIEAANCRIDNLIISAKDGINVGQKVTAKYDYYGGYEGGSKFSWIRITPEGSRDVIHDFVPRNLDNKAGPESYVLTEQDMGCRLKVHVRVLRDDGLTVRCFFVILVQLIAIFVVLTKLTFIFLFLYLY